MAITLTFACVGLPQSNRVGVPGRCYGDNIRFLTGCASKGGNGNRAMTGQKTNDTGFDYDRLMTGVFYIPTPRQLMKESKMMRSKWLSPGIGLGLLLLLGAFALLVSRRSAPVVSVPAVAPVVSSTVSATVNAMVTISTSQVAPSELALPVSVITATDRLTTSNALPDQWQQFSSRTTGYTLSHPPANVTQFEPSTAFVEHAQISFAASEAPAPPLPPFDIMLIDIKVYDGSKGKSIDIFLSELYEEAFRKPITDEKLQALLSRPVRVDGATGYWIDWRIAATRMLFVIPHKDYFYLFALVHQFSPVELSNEEIETFNRVISTISFE